MTNALRPMSLGELLDRTFFHYRKNFLVFVGIMAVPAATFLPLSLLLNSMQTPGAEGWLGNPTMLMVMLPLGLLTGVAGFAVYGAALGAASFAVSELHLGRAVTIRSAYNKVKPHVWRLVLLILGIGIRVFGFAMLFIGLVSGMTIAMGAGMSPIFAGLGMLFGFLAGLILFPIIFLRYSVCVPALVIEGLTARQAAKRSVHLMRQNLGRAFVILILGTVISYVTMMIFQLPFMIAAIVSAAAESSSAMIFMQLGTLFGSIGNAISGPIMLIAFALLYYDLRVRKEAFDLELMMSAIDGTPPPAPQPQAEEPASVVPRQFA